MVILIDSVVRGFDGGVDSGDRRFDVRRREGVSICEGEDASSKKYSWCRCTYWLVRKIVKFGFKISSDGKFHRCVCNLPSGGADVLPDKFRQSIFRSSQDLVVIRVNSVYTDTTCAIMFIFHFLPF